MIFSNERRPRAPQGPPLARYPAPLRRLMFWYDDLSDWQRVQYALAASLFLLACGGYLLGLGSTMVVQRVALEDAVLSAQALATAAVPTATVEPLALPSLPTATPTDVPRQPSSTTVPPTAAPVREPFSGPVIAEPPAVPRSLPANLPPAVVAPVAPRGTPTPDKPRNLELSKPEPPAASIATSTPGTVRTALPAPTAVRQPTPRGGTSTIRPTAASTTLALPATPATPAPTRPATTPAPAGTPAKTPTVR